MLHRSKFIAFILLCFIEMPALAANGNGTEPVFDIPKLDHINIDGNPADWGSNGFRVDAMAGVDGTVRDPAAFFPQFRLGWDDRGLLVLVTVHDAVPSEEDNPDWIYQGDCVELFLAPKVGSSNCVQYLVSPGVDPNHPEPRTKIVDGKTARTVTSAPAKPLSARSKLNDGYVIEALLPWSMIGIEPKLGQEVAVQVQVDDAGTGGLYTAGWYPAPTAGETVHMKTVRLAQKASDSVDVAAGASYDQLRRIKVSLIGSAATAGQNVLVRDSSADANSPPLAVSKLSGGERPTASILLPTPGIGKTAPPMPVFVNQQAIATVELPDLNKLRRSALGNERLTVDQMLFAGKAFPAIEFARPAEVENEIGSYTLVTTFYDEQFKRVQFAASPGRYGAVTEIRDGTGQVIARRFTTLYRMPTEINWSSSAFRASISLPTTMGISDTTVHEQQYAVNQLIGDLIWDGISDQREAGAVLSGLFLKQAGETGENHCSVRRENDQWWHDLKKSIGLLIPYPYVTRLPAGYDPHSARRWPLTLYLHGAGSRGDDLSTFHHDGLCGYADTHPELPFIVVSPQCPTHESWSAAQLTDLLDDVTNKYLVDLDHVYVTGLSMGGFGTWNLAAATPQRFAAAVPIAGGGDPGDAQRLRQLPMWVFHCTGDPIVPFDGDQESVNALKAAGGNVQFTIFPIISHDAWTKAYENPELYTWLLKQRRQPTIMK